MVIQKHVRTTNQDTHTFSAELAYAQVCPIREIQDNYCAFISELQQCCTDHPKDAELAAHVTCFKTMLHHSNTIGALPLWFVTEFYQVTQETDKSVPEKLQLLTAPYQNLQQLSELVQMLQDIQQAITHLIQQHAKVYHTKLELHQLWQQVKELLIRPLHTCGQMQSLPLHLQLMTCNVITHAIDIIDASLKLIKTSQLWSPQERISVFKDMVDDFYQLLWMWLQHPDKVILQRHNVQSYTLLLNRKHQSIMDQAVKQPNNQKLLERSASFSVQAALLTSDTAFARHLPNTLEDLFMLIHQNMLALVATQSAAAFQDKNLYDALYLPSPVKEFVSHFGNRSHTQPLRDAGASYPQLVGIEYTFDALVLRYNLSLSNHSMTFQVIYNMPTNQCLCAVQCLGQARSRWKDVHRLIKSLDTQFIQSEQLTLDETAGIVSWAWPIQHTNQFAKLVEHLSIIVGITFGRVPQSLVPLWQRVLQHPVTGTAVATAAICGYCYLLLALAARGGGAPLKIRLF